jgi:predicted MFS family arabinose efflux permease
MPSVVSVVCVLTFLHYVAAQMRSPVLPLYAVAHGATASGVGIIVGAHMAAAAFGSIPLGRAGDVCGRRALLVGGIAMTVASTLLLPLVENELALALIYGVAGLGVAAFTPSALAVVSEGAPSAQVGQAFAWYTTAHYGGIAVGPFIGGLVAEWWGYPASFLVSSGGAAVALIVAGVVPIRTPHARPQPAASFALVRRNPAVWAGWIIGFAGLVIQGVFFTFFPLLANERGLTAAAIGLIFLVLGVGNIAVRFPAGWLVDRSRQYVPFAVGGIVVASLLTVVVPRVGNASTLVALAAVFGALNGLAGVACGVGLATAATASARGVVMGGYSTALYLGLAVGSLAFGPLITRHGYVLGFALGGVVGVVGALVSATLWMRASQRDQRACATARASVMTPTPEIAGRT